MSWYKRAKKDFEYHREHRSLWRVLVKEEQKRCGISFDLENDDPIASREIKLDYSNRADGEQKVFAQLCVAGGDWECPIYYFRCQLFTRMEKGKGQYSDSLKFVIIPEKYNPNLEKHEGKMVAKGNGRGGEACGDRDEEALWKELKKLAEERSRAYYDAMGNGSFSDHGCVWELTDT